MAPRTGLIAKAVTFFVLAPGTVAGVMPYALTRWRVEAPLVGVPGERLAGGLLVVVGLAGLVECVARFVVEGRGTPAPVAPTEQLVASGLYRHVRNPMYLAVLTTIVGESVWLGSRTLLGYGAVVWAVFHLLVIAYEEPTLHRQFGESYSTYRAAVGRWWPRMTPWCELTRRASDSTGQL